MKMRVAFIGQPEYFSFCYENELEHIGIWEIQSFNLNFFMTSNDFIGLQEFNADINIFFRGEFVPDEILMGLNGIKVNLSSEVFPKYVDGNLVFSLDSLNRYKHFIKSMRSKSFDYIFHYDRTSIRFMQEDNIFLSGEFQFPVATETYQSYDIPEEWDFFFIGRSTIHRDRFFNPLKHHYRFLHICHGIWGSPLVPYMNRSKILLNIHAENETSWEPRVQMLMATGKMVISEKLSCNNYLIPGQDYIEISSPVELYQKAKYYLENHEERLVIAENGKKKVMDLLSSKKVFKQFFIDLTNNKYQRSNFTSLNARSAESRILRLRVRKMINNIIMMKMNR